MRSRAGIVVTGTEVLTGRVADRNGPWLVEQLRERGIDIAQVIVVGDRPDDLRDALRFFAAAGVALVITTGGLGPTADDLTAEVVGEFQDRRVRTRPRARGAHRRDRRAAERRPRLAHAPGGHRRRGPQAGAGAPRCVGARAGGHRARARGAAAGRLGRSADPGAARAAARAAGHVADALADPAVSGPRWASGVELRQRTIRLWGVPESELAAVLRDTADTAAGLEITTCLRDGELEIVTRYGPDDEAATASSAAAIATAFGEAVFSPDGRTVDEIVADALLAGDLTIATAESCTAGLLAGRLTERAGSSAYVLGGLVVYSNEAKTALAGVAGAS